MVDSQQWADELREILRANEASRESLGRLAGYLWQQLAASDCLPRTLPVEAQTLPERTEQTLAEVAEGANAAFARYSSGPVEQLFRRRSLSREQYYLLLAMGAEPEELPMPEWLEPSGKPPAV